jgi:DNA-binding NtrC family response regulator
MNTIKPIPTLKVCDVLIGDETVEQFERASDQDRKQIVRDKAKQFKTQYGILAGDVEKRVEGLLYFLSGLNQWSIPHIYGKGLFEQMVHAVFGGDFYLSILVPPQTTRRPRRILILGETGCGKEAIAEVLCLSIEKAFDAKKAVAVSAADLPDSLLDSALFGHEKGAFTGATAKRKGFLETADEGVLFIDEVGEASATVQAKLLRVLETGTYRRLGGVDEKQSHFHLIAATNRCRQELQNSKDFRKDLFFRLADEIIEVPPLREILAHHENPRIIFETLTDHVAKREFLGLSATGTTELGDRGREVDQFLTEYVSNAFNSKTARKIAHLMRGYAWPGNLRECNHFIRKIFESGGSNIDPANIERRCSELRAGTIDTPMEQGAQAPVLPLKLGQALENFERNLYGAAAGEATSIKQVADLLQVTRQTAARRMGYFNLTIRGTEEQPH